MYKVSDYCADLKYMAMQRQSYYDNSFPGNCCQIHENGVISADCINLLKSLINEPGIAKKTEPVGYYVKPGTTVPDTNENGLLNLCTDVSKDFSKLVPGEYLVMYGSHGGAYVGEFNDGGICNVVECTVSSWASGITTSYVDAQGRRFDHKGGTQEGQWDAHGKMSKWLDYGADSNTSDTKPSQPSQKDTYDIYYRVRTAEDGWLPEVKNTEDYAGIRGHKILDVAVKVSKGSIDYEAHVLGGNWLGKVNGYNINEPNNGYAGDGKPIDLFKAYLWAPNSDYRVAYKVSPVNQNYYPVQYDTDTDKGQDGYAGSTRVAIDRIQMWIEKC